MKIDQALLDYLQALSRLTLTPEELAAAGDELSKILGYMSKLDEVDTQGAPELSHPLAGTNCLRDDVVEESFAREKMLAGAPDSDGRYYRAPKTVD